MKPWSTKLSSPSDAIATPHEMAMTMMNVLKDPTKTGVSTLPPPGPAVDVATRAHRGFIFSSPAATDMPSTATAVNALIIWMNDTDSVRYATFEKIKLAEKRAVHARGSGYGRGGHDSVSLLTSDRQNGATPLTPGHLQLVEAIDEVCEASE